MTHPNTQYTITWEVWNSMITNLGKTEARLERALELIQTLIESGEPPDNLEKLIAWKKCISDCAKLKTEKEKYV